jgi:hypothetical protein
MVEIEPPARVRRCVSAGHTRRRLLGAAGLAGLVGAACGPVGEQKPPAGRESQKNAVMDAWVHADTRSAWQKLTLEDYNKEKGYNVTVNWTRLASTSEVADKVVVTTAAGSGFPDMVDVEISQMGKLLKTPTPPLVAFNDYLKGRENDFFKPSFVDPWSLNGKYYGLGNELNVCLMARLIRPHWRQGAPRDLGGSDRGREAAGGDRRVRSVLYPYGHRHTHAVQYPGRRRLPRKGHEADPQPSGQREGPPVPGGTDPSPQGRDHRPRQHGAQRRAEHRQNCRGTGADVAHLGRHPD